MERGREGECQRVSIRGWWGVEDRESARELVVEGGGEVKTGRVPES